MIQPTVLLVEEDPDVRGAMAEALQDEGYEVAMAINGHEGLRVLRALETPCLVLVDLELARVGGRAMLEALGKEACFEGSRVVGMDAHPGARPPGVVALVRKPVRLEDLLTVAREHCPREAPVASGASRPVRVRQ
ncbi:response regulator [Myxococcus sp. K15C18031901]|uniref:response regulator n=1 Tax=Myxococcus dinghuensis TaxID=2906761 RepID=UPI0020A808D3|nr:response regulator [Myxococcus dinghuensis]MCP3105180.1 response regulator [Myxococcus dinghuensis]